ncbi:hypothetical protein CUJ84_pRLN3000286 (plasmid) [Rhizobium leguminosarum]|uniref:Uncharacterized protein n=1 Tax=Rhizobium leguminosarum TaxID=384 RepID=A0A2K9ZH93_RHILE|nr:hypothetical protein CUJ84_pRLN3000286 [Rhizobium leguminosarum]
MAKTHWCAGGTALESLLLKVTVRSALNVMDVLCLPPLEACTLRRRGEADRDRSSGGRRQGGRRGKWGNRHRS